MTTWPKEVSKWALRGTVIALPLSTSLHEISLAVLLATGLAGGGALWVWLRAKPDKSSDITNIFEDHPFPIWLAPAFVAAACFVLGALPLGDLREGLGHAWLLAPLLAIPLAHVTKDERRILVRCALAAASLAAILALLQRAGGGVATGAFGHHLTLAYAMVPPFAAAVAFRMWPVAVLLAAGSLASGSAAAPISLMVAGFAASLGSQRGGRSAAISLGVGAVATLTGIALFADTEELRQRAVMWTGGLSIAPGSAGAGGYGVATEAIYDRLSPGFYFPNHAHDSAIQLYATLGPAGCVAVAFLVGTIFRRGHRAAAAGLAGVLVGGLTQDVLGDLEVARALWVWTAVLGVAPQIATAAEAANGSA